ncbi:TPA: hypothetical protein ACVU5P_004178 [Vibrio parahaemolyticus]
MIKNKQRLNHNLLPYLKKVGDQELFSHPAYVCVYFTEPHVKSTQNTLINNKAITGYSKFNDAKRAGAYFASLTFIDPYHRLSQFLKFKDEIKSQDEYWKIVKSLLEVQPYGYADTGPWLKIFKRSDNPTIRTDFFTRLPDVLTIYQAGGALEFGTAAMKWTLSKQDALRDESLYGSCSLRTGTIDKNKILYVHHSPNGSYLYLDSRDVKNKDK